MNKKMIGILLLCLTGIISIFLVVHKNTKKEKTEVNELTASVLSVNQDKVSVTDTNQGIYTFSIKDLKASVGDSIVIRYAGLIDKEKELQDNAVIEYSTLTQVDDDLLPTEWLEEGLFQDYYQKAYEKLKTLSLDERIGQLLLVRYKEDTAIKDLNTYHFGGFVFFEKDFKNKTSDAVKNMINDLQKNATIPLLTAVDEEGGKIVRVSSNPNLVDTPFQSSKDLYKEGGFPKITTDTKEKSNILYKLGLNLNLAPVVDVSTNTSAYMYERSFGADTALTSTYAKTVIEASKGTGVSYTLKHFPGYGNNTDTHVGSSTDNRTYDDILNNDIPPFDAGIHAGAEAVLVSHNIVTSIDNTNPASLSPSVHNILRNRLDFSGIIITDDLDMGATSSIQNRTVRALLAGNDLIITTDYAESFSELKSALNDDTISEDLVNRVALRVLAWKYYKGLIFENEK